MPRGSSIAPAPSGSWPGSPSSEVVESGGCREPPRVSLPPLATRRTATDWRRPQQEEIKLERLRESLIEVELVRRQMFAVAKLFRQRLNAWVSRAAPVIALDLVIVRGKVDEGSVWRAMTREMRKFQ